VRRLELKVPPVAVFLVSGAIMWPVSKNVPSTAFALPGSWIIAVVLAVMGFGIATSGVIAFRRHETTVNPTKPEEASSMVAVGAYRYTRNPMYLGLTMGLTAWAVYLSNAAALLLVLVFVLYMTQFQIKPEERALQAKFGSSYDTYKAAVRRWL